MLGWRFTTLSVEVRKSHFAAAWPDGALDTGFSSGIKPSPQWGVGQISNRNPRAAWVLPRRGNIPNGKGWGVNDSFTWGAGCPQK